MPDREPLDESERLLHSVLGKMVQGMRMSVEGQGDARTRVFNAGRVLITIDPGALPDPIAGELEEINQWLTRFPAASPEETSLDATLRRTRNSSAAKMAAKISHLYQHVREIYAEQLKEEE